ncbi:MAG TPA: discoidin domain-containing protein [Actinomycetota bacterium]|nr:discoidin domain-containing protein [Actinomycetota bacterium]
MWLGLRVAVSLSLLALLLPACSEQSRVDPGADIAVAGTVMRQDGAGVNGVRVVMSRDAGLGEALSLVFSFGLACIDEKIREACGKTREVVTGPDGGFRFALKGRDTQTSGGSAATMELAARLPRSSQELEGPAVRVRHLVQTSAVQIPMRAWEPALEVKGDATTVSVTWPPLDPGLLPAYMGAAASYDVRFETTSGGLVWAQPLAPGGTFDARVLEDTVGAVSVEAAVPQAEVPDEAGTRVSMRLSSARFAYKAMAGRPVSRSKGCYVLDAAQRPVAQSGCAVTDGDFRRTFTPAGAECPPGEQCPTLGQDVTIDLGSPRPIRLVVLRGCDDECAVLASPDGAAWEAVGAGAGFEDSAGEDNMTITPVTAISGRYLRVTGSVHTLREVSVWDDTAHPAPAPAGSLIVAPDELPDRTPPGQGERGLALVVLATVLALLAASAAFFTRPRS